MDIIDSALSDMADALDDSRPVILAMRDPNDNVNVRFYNMDEVEAVDILERTLDHYTGKANDN